MGVNSGLGGTRLRAKEGRTVPGFGRKSCNPDPQREALEHLVEHDRGDQRRCESVRKSTSDSEGTTLTELCAGRDGHGEPDDERM